MRIKFKEGHTWHHGDSRVVKRFLWWPVLLDRELRWLETAYIVQRYSRVGYWYNKRFATQEEIANWEE